MRSLSVKATRTRAPRGHAVIPSTRSAELPSAAAKTSERKGATETGAASTHVHGLAQSLLGQSNHLKGEVEKFLSTVRAA